MDCKQFNQKRGSLLQNIVSFIGLFCKRDLCFYRVRMWHMTDFNGLQAIRTNYFWLRIYYCVTWRAVNCTRHLCKWVMCHMSEGVACNFNLLHVIFLFELLAINWNGSCATCAFKLNAFKYIACSSRIYGVATISRLPKTIGLFCKRAL